ncbi:MAG: hypothetical protein HY332_20255 [Chloroflexi bacterium]|nr:hypothetical protein [Chloroflexota bacterium]
MRWVRDALGRVPQRPHYDPDEIDRECEAVATVFLAARYRRVSYPLSTNDLTILLEQRTSDLDLYAELDDEGDDAEGVTEFVPGQKPRVRIARRLSETSARGHRLRTTLAHELGHVLFHGFLWSLDRPAGAGTSRAGPVGATRGVSASAVPRLSMAAMRGSSPLPFPRCRRSTILGAGSADWLEWQAGYASGAFLMPAQALARVVAGEFAALGGAASLRAPLPVDSASARALIRHVARAFDVSSPAARVRLLQRGYLTKRSPARGRAAAAVAAYRR